MMRWLRRWHDRVRHPARYARLAELMPVAGWSRAELLRHQRRALEDTIRFAAARSDFYAVRLGPLLPPAYGPIDVAALPVLEKQDVRDHMDEMLVRDADHRQVKVGHTGGSTGSPLAFYYDDAKHELMLAGMMRGFMMSGWRPGQRVLYLWGAARDVAPGAVFDRRHDDPLGVERVLAAFEYSEARLDEWVRVIRRWRPVLLYGYASALGELARYIVDAGLPPPHGLIGVYSTAEMLDERQRELMQQAFGCKVFNQYGCREVPNIAWECRDGQMHVFSDLVYLESVPADGGDRLLVTSLTDRVMPFIRYATGDSGRLLEDACSCGLPFPLMRMDMCRHNDLIRTRGGKRVHPAYFNRLLYGLTQIRQYQWEQAALDRLRLNLVSDRPLEAETLQSIEGDIQRDVDQGMRLEVCYLAEIPRTAAGKHRYVIGLPPGAGV